MSEELVTTIGLEVHVELKTATKMFCGCPVEFGGEPNTRVCPVCLGHPGTLPVMNEKAIEYTTKIAMALGCEVAAHTIFHRKNYFYPDMPKNYQISQYDLPIGGHGMLEVKVDGQRHKIGITRAHLEEDTGKSLHVGGGGRIHDADYSLEDFNRAGTPLVEIVSEPDIHSPEVARAYVAELRSILEYLGVSDVRMEEGSMRVDANISVAPPGERGVKIEIKNMNSIRSVHHALQYEEKRQRKLLRSQGTLEQSTRHWDEKSGRTNPLRTKEEAFDYRYFPEPDLVPIEPGVEWLNQLREELPVLPAERRHTYEDELGLSGYDAGVLTATQALGNLFEKALNSATKADAKQVANWVTNNLAGLLAADDRLTIDAVQPADLANLVDMVAGGDLSTNQGHEVLAQMLKTGKDPKTLVEEAGIKQVSDASELEGIIDQVIADHPDVAERIRAGDQKPFGFLMGQAMKATKGQGNPKVVTELLKSKLS